MVPFESLGTVSYSFSIVTMAVCLAISEVFSVKQWREVRVRSRSLKMSPFDRPYATFYSSAIVNIALSLPFSSYLTLNDLETGAYTQDFISGGAEWRAREREPIMGVWGLCPQRGPGAEPLVGVRGRSPLKLKAICCETP